MELDLLNYFTRDLKTVKPLSLIGQKFINYFMENERMNTRTKQQITYNEFKERIVFFDNSLYTKFHYK